MTYINRYSKKEAITNVVKASVAVFGLGFTAMMPIPAYSGTLNAGTCRDFYNSGGPIDFDPQTGKWHSDCTQVDGGQPCVCPEITCVVSNNYAIGSSSGSSSGSIATTVIVGTASPSFTGTDAKNACEKAAHDVGVSCTASQAISNNAWTTSSTYVLPSECGGPTNIAGTGSNSGSNRYVCDWNGAPNCRVLSSTCDNGNEARTTSCYGEHRCGPEKDIMANRIPFSRNAETVVDTVIIPGSSMCRQPSKATASTPGK